MFFQVLKADTINEQEWLSCVKQILWTLFIRFIIPHLPIHNRHPSPSFQLSFLSHDFIYATLIALYFLCFLFYSGFHIRICWWILICGILWSCSNPTKCLSLIFYIFVCVKSISLLSFVAISICNLPAILLPKFITVVPTFSL